jgi:hypothetical protein
MKLKILFLIFFCFIIKCSYADNYITKEEYESCKYGNVSYKNIQATKGTPTNIQALFSENFHYEVDNIIGTFSAINSDITIVFTNEPNSMREVTGVFINPNSSMSYTIKGLTLKIGDDRSKLNNYDDHIDDTIIFTVKDFENNVIIILFDTNNKIKEICHTQWN